jgi:hypothetical protein
MQEKYELNHLLLDENSDVADDFRVKWTPAALLLNPDGKIATSLAMVIVRFGSVQRNRIVRPVGIVEC